jgi:hypothetical protein
MSIFASLFGSTPAAPAQPAAPAPATNGAGQPGNIPANPAQVPAATPGTAPNGVVPAGTPEPAPAANASPLDQFSELWQPNANPTEQQPLINVDPKALAEAARKTDFTKMIAPEHLQAISQGGEAAVQAFAQAMNQVGQGVYAQAAFASTKITEQAIAKAMERFQNEIPAHVKRLNVSESLRSENPALSHPAAAPLLGALEQTLSMKHPNASSSELTQMAKQYLSAFAGAANAPQTAADAAAASAKDPKATDWAGFL